MIKELVSFNHTSSINDTFRPSECIKEPESIDGEEIFYTIYLPLIAMFLLQVLFNFVIRRIILFFVLPYVFQKRAKARIIQLYNKLLFGRINSRKLARARIREAVRQKEIQKNKKGWYVTLFWLINKNEITILGCFLLMMDGSSAKLLIDFFMLESV